MRSFVERDFGIVIVVFFVVIPKPPPLAVVIVENTLMLEVMLLFTTGKRKQITWAIIEVHHTSIGDANLLWLSKPAIPSCLY